VVVPAKNRRKKRKKHIKRKTSIHRFTWKEQKSGKWKCVLCDTLKKKFKSSNMKEHWESKHKKAWASVVRANTDGKDVTAVVQTLIDSSSKSGGAMDFFVKTTRRHQPRESTTVSGRMQKEISLLRWMICSKTSFNSIEDSSFDDLCQCWGVSLDKKTTILALIPIMFDVAVSWSEKRLAKCDAVSCGIDFWTSKAKRKYLAVTYHGCTPDWKLIHHVLDLVHFPGTTFSELSAAVIQQRIDNHLPQDVLAAAVVSDCGADVRKTRNDLLNMDGEDCYNHLENSALNDVFGSDGLKDLKSYKDVLAVSHLISVITSDKNLELFFHRLQKASGFDDVLAFVTRNDTRWEGLMLMLERFVRLQDALLFKSNQAEEMRLLILEDWPVDLSQDIFQKIFFLRLEGIITILTPFSVASKSVQSLSRPTASQIPGLVHSILTQLEKAAKEQTVGGIAELACALSLCVQKRCGHYLTTVNNALKAALVDPSQARFVTSFGVTEKLIEKCWDAIVAEAGNFTSSGDGLFGDVDMDADYAASAKKLRDALQKTDVERNSPDPLSLYRKNNDEFQKHCGFILNVVRMLLSIPGGESHCERVFSWLADIVTKKRTRLGNSMLEMTLILYDVFKMNDFDWDEFQDSLDKEYTRAKIASLRQSQVK